MPSNCIPFIGCNHDYKTSNIVLFGAPFDGTVSFRPGTRFAPGVIRVESYGLETYSPYLNRDLNDLAISDIGDIEITYGNTQKTIDSIYNQSKSIVADNKIPFMMGGEHLVTLSNVQAVSEKYPNLKVIQFDAHADLRDDYEGEKLSHATVMRRVHDLLGDRSIYQLGIRSGLKEEFEFAKKHLTIEQFNVSSANDLTSILSDSPVYITIDLDVLDPSVMMGTGTPEPGGVSFQELLSAVHSLKGLNVVGCDVVELSPHYDQSGVSTAVAAKLIRELLLIL